MKPLGPHDLRSAGRIEILAAIGEGGMGRVLLGRGPDGRLVAVKQIHPSLAHDPGFRQRFAREIDLSRRVTGAYTAAVVDADPDGPVPWMASVYVAGPSLRDAIDEAGPLPVTALRLLLGGLSAALAELHGAGLVHRDLKPGNVILAEDGPRVIDFGIARATEGGKELTHTGSVLGSPAFMSPEQAEGRELTPASDIFSLGVLMAMAALGDSPFAGTSAPQVLFNVVHAEPDLSAIPEPLRSVIASCLDKHPPARPTAHALLDWLATKEPPAGWPRAIREHIAGRHAEVQSVLGRPAAYRGDPAPTRAAKIRAALVVGLVAIIALAALDTALVLRKPTIVPTAIASEEPLTVRIPLDKLRLIDACALLTDDVVKQAGAQTARPARGTWGTCSVSMIDRTGNDLMLMVRTGWETAAKGFKDTGVRQSGAPILSAVNGNECRARAATTFESGIDVNVNTPAADRCQAATNVMKVLLERLEAEVPQVQAGPGSYRVLDPCSLAGPEAAANMVGRVSKTANSTHTCDFEGADTSARITLGYTNRIDKNPNNKPFAIAGTTAFETTSPVTPRCYVVYQGAVDNVDAAEQLSVRVETNTAKGVDYAAACERAKAVLAGALPKLPKQ